MEVIIIRHGKTQGNLEQKYIGITDDPLCEIGINELKERTYPKADLIISSPLKRCRQTAEIIYGRYDEVVEGLRECNFGTFENKSFVDMENDDYYHKWVESGGKLPFPNGECMESFKKRTIEAFEDTIARHRNVKRIAFVVHGGTIMAVGSKYKGGNFYDYHFKNGEYMVISL